MAGQVRSRRRGLVALSVVAGLLAVAWLGTWLRLDADRRQLRRQLEAAGQAQAADRFARALDQLGSEQLEVRPVPESPPGSLVEQILSRQPAVTLTVAMRGLEALDMARNDPPDLVLLDLHLPDLPGEEVLRMLRRDPRTEAVPVVVVSADATPGQAERLRGAGAKEYLTKPLEVRRLLEVLRDNLPAAQAVSRGGP
jgi:CheY-like chemotaxis protein